MALIWSFACFSTYVLRFFSIYAFGFSSIMHFVYAIGLTRHLCTSQIYLLLCYLSSNCILIEIWSWIIFKHHLVTKIEQLVGCNQTNSFVELSASLLVLVKVYWLDDKSPPLCLLANNQGILAKWQWYIFMFISIHQYILTR